MAGGKASSVTREMVARWVRLGSASDESGSEQGGESGGEGGGAPGGAGADATEPETERWRR